MGSPLQRYGWTLGIILATLIFATWYSYEQTRAQDRLKQHQEASTVQSVAEPQLFQLSKEDVIANPIAARIGSITGISIWQLIMPFLVTVVAYLVMKALKKKPDFDSLLCIFVVVWAAFIFISIAGSARSIVNDRQHEKERSARQAKGVKNVNQRYIFGGQCEYSVAFPATPVLKESMVSDGVDGWLPVEVAELETDVFLHASCMAGVNAPTPDETLNALAAHIQKRGFKNPKITKTLNGIDWRGYTNLLDKDYIVDSKVVCGETSCLVLEVGALSNTYPTKTSLEFLSSVRLVRGQ